MKFFDSIPLKGWSFSVFKEKHNTFEKLFEIFKELITYTSGDFDEAIDWLRQLDKEYVLTDENYTIDDFIEDLLNKGFVTAEISTDGDKSLNKISAKMEKALRVCSKRFWTNQSQHLEIINQNIQEMMMMITITKIVNTVIKLIKL